MDKKPWEFDPVSFLEAERRINQQIAEFSKIREKDKTIPKILPERNYSLSYIASPLDIGAALSELNKRTGIIYTCSEMYLPNEDPRRQSAIDGINQALFSTRKKI